MKMLLLNRQGIFVSGNISNTRSQDTRLLKISYLKKFLPSEILLYEILHTCRRSVLIFYFCHQCVYLVNSMFSVQLLSMSQRWMAHLKLYCASELHEDIVQIHTFLIYYVWGVIVC